MYTKLNLTNHHLTPLISHHLMKKFCSPYERTNSCLQSALFIYNIVFWLLGAGVVAAGLYLFLEQNEFSGVTRFFFLLPTILVLASGLSMLSLGCFPICGLLKQNRLLLTAFSFAALVIACVLLAAAGFGLSVMIGERTGVNATAAASLPRYVSCDNTRTSWDLLQRNFQCCGLNGPDDWKQLSSQLGYVPSSCCRNNSVPNCGLVQSAKVQVFDRGCLSLLTTYEHRQLAISSTVCLATAMYTLMGSLLSFILIINFSSKNPDD